MLTKLSVRNFRNLNSINLEQLGRITLIAGKNGAGKTALLETLWMLSGADLPELSTRVNTFRGLPVLAPETVFHELFRDFDTDRTIKIAAGGDWGRGERSLEIGLRQREEISTMRPDSMERSDTERLTIAEDEGEYEIVFKYVNENRRKFESRAWWAAEHLPAAGGPPGMTLTNEGIRQQRQPIRNRPTSVFLAAVHRESLQTTAARLGKVQLSGDEDKILDFVRAVEPRLNGLAGITIRNTTVIHAYLKGFKRPMPIQLLGEGFNRMVILALAMSESAGGLVLVDEIENGLHYSVQAEVFSYLLKLSQLFDVQIFATTHSAECISAAHRSLDQCHGNEFAYYHLERNNGEVNAVPFDREMLETAITHEMEIR